MNANLLEFMRTGIFGALKHGMSPVEVRTLLGAPDNNDPGDEDGRAYWYYGQSLLVFLFEGIVDRVFLYWRPPGFELPASIDLCGPVFTLDTTIDEICDVLRQESIAYEHEAQPHTDKICALRTGVKPSRVQVVFDSKTRKLIEMVDLNGFEG